jgi:hypothetical protein
MSFLKRTWTSFEEFIFKVVVPSSGFSPKVNSRIQPWYQFPPQGWAGSGPGHKKNLTKSLTLETGEPANTGGVWTCNHLGNYSMSLNAWLT